MWRINMHASEPQLLEEKKQEKLTLPSGELMYIYLNH